MGKPPRQLDTHKVLRTSQLNVGPVDKTDLASILSTLQFSSVYITQHNVGRKTEQKNVTSFLTPHV
jgi:hypothetical protein